MDFYISKMMLPACFRLLYGNYSISKGDSPEFLIHLRRIASRISEVPESGSPNSRNWYIRYIFLYTWYIEYIRTAGIQLDYTR